jgi:hypothetical protein
MGHDGLTIISRASEIQQIGKMDSLTFFNHLFPPPSCPDFGESFIKNDPVQTLRNFSSSRIISQR